MPVSTQVLPNLHSGDDSIRNNPYYNIQYGGYDDMIVAKNVLQLASKNVKTNSDAFKVYMQRIYEEQQKLEPNFQYDKKNITSAAFDTISQHIADTLSEASNSSIFERKDKLKIMEYINTAIKNADVSEEERKQLAEQYTYAANSIKNSAGVFDRASSFMIRHLGDLTGVLGSIMSDLPPLWGWMFTRGGDMIGNWLERKRTKKERLSALEFDIANAEDERNGDENVRPSLMRPNQMQRMMQDSLDSQDKPPQALERLSNNGMSDFAQNKMERIQNASGSLLDKAPTGARGDPLFVRIDDMGMPKQEDKNQGILGNLAGLIGGLGSRLEGVLTKLLGPLAGLLGVGKAAKAAQAAKTATDAAKNLMPDADGKNKNAAKTGTTKTAKKPSMFQRVAKGVKTAAKGAALLGGPLAIGVGIAEGLGALYDWSRGQMDKARADAKAAGVDFVEPRDIDADNPFASFEHLKGQNPTSKFEQQKPKDEGLVTESKDSARATVGTQTDLASQSRAKANAERKQQELTLNQQNHNTVVNNYNHNTNNQTNRIIQIQNPQANLVHGTR